MDYLEWEHTVPERLKLDPVWQFFAYRKALFLFDLAWDDCQVLMRDVRGRTLVGQLIDSIGSVSANIEEGFGRGYGKDRNRFLRFSAGSAREGKGWYFRSRRLLAPSIIQQRLTLADEIIALLVTELKRQQSYR